MARFVKASFDSNTQVITWTIAGQAPVTLNLNQVSAAVRARACVHGFIQRCSDNAADEKTASGKREAIAAMAEFYASGTDEWGRARKGGVGVRFDGGAVIAAVARVLFASDVDKANRAADAVATKRGISRDDALKLFAADERVAADIARAKALAAPAKVNADELTAEIEGMDDEPEPTDEELDALTQPETEPANAG